MKINHTSHGVVCLQNVVQVKCLKKQWRLPEDDSLKRKVCVGCRASIEIHPELAIAQPRGDIFCAVARDNIIVVVRACPLKQTEYCSPLRCCTRGACARSSFPRRIVHQSQLPWQGPTLRKSESRRITMIRLENHQVYTLPSLEIDSNKRNLLAINFYRRCSTLV